MKMPNPPIELSINKEAVKKIMSTYWGNLDKKVSETIEQCMKRNGYQVYKKGVCDKTLRQFTRKLEKKNRKLIVAISTSDPRLDIKGNEVVYKRIWCEIVKKGLKKKTFINMIVRRHSDVVSLKTTWEICDYLEVYNNE